MARLEPSEVLGGPSYTCGACDAIVPIWDFPPHIHDHTDQELAQYRGGSELLRGQLAFVLGAAQAAQELSA